MKDLWLSLPLGFAIAMAIAAAFKLITDIVDRRKRAATPEVKIVRYVRLELVCHNCHEPIHDGQHIVMYSDDRPMTHVSCLSQVPEGMHEDDFKHLWAQACSKEAEE
jgi:hypothetical protein